MVWTAKHEPRRYGKNGETLIEYEETGEHQRRRSYADRRGSVISTGSRTEYGGEKGIGRQEEYRGNPGGPSPGSVSWLKRDWSGLGPDLEVLHVVGYSTPFQS